MVNTAHEDLHTEQGALPGDRPARAANPVIKVEDLAWLEFEKPGLDAAERFARDFGFAAASRTDSELHLRGTLPGSQCVIIHNGTASRFAGAAFRAADRGDLERLASRTGVGVRDRRGVGSGAMAGLADPSGIPVRVVADVEALPELPGQRPLPLNFGRLAGRTPHGVRRASRRGLSGWGTWCWRPRCLPAHWTGLWTTSGLVA